MPPKLRARLSSRRRLPVLAAGPCSRGWLSLRRRPSKRPRRHVDSSSRGGAEQDGNGTPLCNDILVNSIFADLPIPDLVRISATCRRWRRLVSSEAAFISRTPRQPGRYLRCLALGFFYQDMTAGVAPRFAPMASATRFRGLRQTSLNTLLEDLDHGLFDSSRLVASRNGLLVVDLRGGRHDRALRLCVCNPMTGKIDILPPLTGKDGLGQYACTVLTADDRDHNNSDPPRTPSAYRLLLVYSRRGFTASRSYSSEEGSWSPQVMVTKVRLGKKRMGMTRAGAVIRGGKVVYWIAENQAFGLHVDTSEAGLLSLPWVGSPLPDDIFMANTLLGVSPDGSLCAVVVEDFCLIATAERPRSIALGVYTWSHSHAGNGVPTPWAGGADWKRKELIQIEQFMPAEVTKMKMRWFCEKSGVVLFVARYSDESSEVYALSLETQEVEKVASHDGVFAAGINPAAIDTWGNLHGYEMDRAAYLGTLGEGDDAAEEEVI